MAVHLPDDLAQRILKHAETCYPEEACGLLTGRRDGDAVVITGIHESDNVTERDRKTGFEIDPKLRFDLMRETEAESTVTAIVGHYHSHPDQPAEPSATDLSMAFETEFVWLICGVQQGCAGPINAFRPREDRSRFEPLTLR